MMDNETFKKLKTYLKSEKVKFKSVKDWELILPHKTTAKELGRIMSFCRDNVLSTWHIKFSESTEKEPKPDILMYWEKKKLDADS
mgnify:CR=1 FL=1